MKASFGDALVLCATRDIEERLDCFVSRIAAHFKAKLEIDALTQVECFHNHLGGRVRI